MKFCTKCGNEHPEEFFNWKSKKAGRRSTICKNCSRNYGNNYYGENATDMKANARRSNIRRIESNINNYLKYLQAHPCICGENDPVALDPDHNGDKKYDISTMIRHGHCWGGILIELAKCTIRCANCHRKKTAKEQSWLKHLLHTATPTETLPVGVAN